MGLDIYILTDNPDGVITADYHDEEHDYFNKHSLSRTFCNFMCRQGVVDHEPELNQIGKIAGVDITPLYEMERYPDEEGLEFFLETAEDEEERQKILQEAEEDKANLDGNIEKVLHTVSNLVQKLGAVDNLPSLLLPTDDDTLNNQKYFADFNIDKGEGYIGNNFGQDLRNFERFLLFAKEHGATTVWFQYG